MKYVIYIEESGYEHASIALECETIQEVVGYLWGRDFSSYSVLKKLDITDLPKLLKEENKNEPFRENTTFKPD